MVRCDVSGGAAARRGPASRLRILAAACAAALLLAGCGNSQSGGTGLFLPPANFVADPERGKPLFAAHCARCHGADARGSEHGPPLLHRIYEPNHHSDMAFYRAVNKGSQQHHWGFGDMPPVAGVSAEEAGHIIVYVRREQVRVGIR